MDSRLLNTLNAQARGTRDPVIWAKAVCRAASHFAAHGKTEEALTAIGVVRSQFGKDLHFDIASWLMLAEGVLHYFKAQIPEAYDRTRRAYGLAIALRNNSAFPSCAAWMAHLEFNAGKFDDMAQHLEEALTTAEDTDHQAIARASLVLAVAYHIAGDFQLSRPWYEKARLNAAAEGDDATVSATLHNMATIRAANVRLEDAFGEDSAKETKRVSLEASSSLTYDYAIGHRGLEFLTKMLSGLISTINKKYSEALRSFESIDIEQVPNRLRPLILVDQAWCLVQSSDKLRALSVVNELTNAIPMVADDDDLAYIHARLHHILSACDHAEDAARHANLAELAIARHKAFQTGFIAKLNNINTGRHKKSPV